MYKTSTRHKRHVEYDLQGDLEKIKSAVADAAVSARGTASEAIKQSWDNALAKSAEFEEYAKDRPYKTLGFAILLGGILGFMMRGKR